MDALRPPTSETKDLHRLLLGPEAAGPSAVGSTLLVRQRTATGQSDVNRSAPEEPTGKPE